MKNKTNLKELSTKEIIQEYLFNATKLIELPDEFDWYHTNVKKGLLEERKLLKRELDKKAVDEVAGVRYHTNGYVVSSVQWFVDQNGFKDISIRFKRK